MPSRIIGVFALVTCSVAFYSSGRVHSQAKRPMTLVDLLNIPRVGDPQLSPDGRQIVFTRRWIDKLNDRWESALWIMDADGSYARRISEPPFTAAFPDYFPRPST